MSAALASIQFSNLDVDYLLKDSEQLKVWLMQIAKAEGCFIARLHYHFCSDEHLLSINQEHLDHDYYTDVITFDESRLPVIKGDVFISVDRTADNAKTLAQEPIIELYRVIAHGLLHLVGYGDKNPEEALIMRDKEKWALKQLH